MKLLLPCLMLILLAGCASPSKSAYTPLTGVQLTEKGHAQ